VLTLKICEIHWILWLIRILIFSSSCGSISLNIINWEEIKYNNAAKQKIAKRIVMRMAAKRLTFLLHKKLTIGSSKMARMNENIIGIIIACPI
jgi:hypothetical protein